MHATSASHLVQPRPEPLLLRRVESHDIEAHQEGLPCEWSLRYEQLTSGRFRGVYTEAVMPQVRLFSEFTTQMLRQRGTMGPDCVSLGVPMLAGDEPYFRGQRWVPDAIFVGHGDFDFSSPACFEVAGLTVSFEVLDDIWARLYSFRMAPWRTPHGGLAVDASVMSGVRSQIQAALATFLACPQLLHDPRAAAQMQDALLCQVLEAMAAGEPLDDLKSAAARKKVVDRVCELVLSRPDAPPSLLDICKEVGASRRKLLYCFQDSVGMGPARYLRAMRLNGVRRELRRAHGGTGVLDVAARWGFWHFSQFSANYKEQFGELPSQTRRIALAS